MFKRHVSSLKAGIPIRIVKVADDRFSPSDSSPAYSEGGGPVVYLDEAHHNFHAIEGRYATFGKLLRRDGFVVAPMQKQFTAEALVDADVLVIATALARENAESELDWRLPAHDDEYFFERADGSLVTHPITDGRSEDERIEYVRTFTGQAFWLTQPGVPILKLKPDSVVPAR